MTRAKRNFSQRLVATLLLILCAGPTYADFSTGDDAPVERLVKNIAAVLEKTPADSQALYLMGRVYALAYTYRTTVLKAYDFKDQESVLPQLNERARVTPQTIPAELQKRYLHDAIESYRAAIRYAPRNPLYHLSLASLIESAHGDIAECNPELAPADSSPVSAEEVQKIMEESAKGSTTELQKQSYNRGARLAPILRNIINEYEMKAFFPDRTKLIERMLMQPSADKARELLISIWREEAIYHYWIAYVYSVRNELHMHVDSFFQSSVSQGMSECYDDSRSCYRVTFAAAAIRIKNSKLPA